MGYTDISLFHQAKEDRVDLSEQAMSLWGKTNRVDETMWLPLYVHMSDSAAVAGHLWDEWVPAGTKDVLARNFGGDLPLARKVFLFIAGVHDIGKATPLFQCTPITHSLGLEEDSLAWIPKKAGLSFPIDSFVHHREPSHAIAGELIFQSYLSEIQHWDKLTAESYACIVGGHHGQPPTREQLNRKDYGERLGWDTRTYGNCWVDVQGELINFIARQSEISDDDFKKLAKHRLDIYAETVITGIVIMADWIASNSNDGLFPLIPLMPLQLDQKARAQMASVRSLKGLRHRQDGGWRELGLSSKWQPTHTKVSINELFATRFNLPPGASPRPVQMEAARIAQSATDPGIMVIEAPMGEGKTEAALAAAEILAKRTGRGGVCVALPTMATTDAMFSRFMKWVDAVPQEDGRAEKSISLRHGKAALNKQFANLRRSSSRLNKSASVDGSQELEEDPVRVSVNHGSGLQDTPEVVVSDWLIGRKKGVLANFLVCTIDQVLMSSLQMKHVALRQLALVNKVVIIDECHAYDAYMREYLQRTLKWLGGFHTPVILLSATLPEQLRSQLVDAYRTGYQSTSYNGLSAKEIELTRLGEKITQEDDPLAVFRYKESVYRKHDGDHGTVPQQDKEQGNSKSGSEGDVADALKQYPLITYTVGPEVKVSPVDTSSRWTNVDCRMLGDDDAELIRLLKDKLRGGGCAGIVCDTVGRAQHTAKILTEVFGDNIVKLTHSRFIDLDRMDNEVALRDKLGPEATIRNGHRPDQLIVVGTQVLEQSLDIDFDLMVSDIAPVDLLLQRVGRLHRHRRGEDEGDRPSQLRKARCYIRGIDTWDDACPTFAKGIDFIYPAASLLETLSVLSLTGLSTSRLVHLPTDIAHLVRTAYDLERVEELIPRQWLEAYHSYADKREKANDREIAKAHIYLMHDPAELIKNNCSTVDLCNRSLTSHNEEKARQAVRDTMDSVEVLLLQKSVDGYRLLPWVGGEGLEYGAPVSVDEVPDARLAQTILRCAVRLPLLMSSSTGIDGLIEELEMKATDFVDTWHESDWLDGCLPMILFPDFAAEEKESNNAASLEREGSSGAEETPYTELTFKGQVHGFNVQYSRARGLEVSRRESDEGGL